MAYIIKIESHGDSFYLFSYGGWVDEWISDKDSAIIFVSFKEAEIAKKSLRDQSAKIEEC